MRADLGTLLARHTRRLLVAACIIGAISSAHAAGTPAPGGTVGTITLVGSGTGAPGAYDFRVSLVGNPVICNGQIWAYINVTDANYSAITASILEAKAMGAPIQLYYTQGSDGYCLIDWMQW
jgi:hypothetical protein